MSLSTKEESPWDVLKRVSDSGVTKYKEELPKETAEEVYDPENNRSNEGAKKLLKEGRETVKNWLSFLNDDDEPTKVAPAESAPKEAAPAEETLTESFTNWFSLFNSEPEEKVAPATEPATGTDYQPMLNVKPVDIETEMILKKTEEVNTSLPYPNVLDSNEAIYGELWGRAFHTEAEYDAAKQLDYKTDVALYVVPNSNYVNTMVPILNKVIPAFEGDSNVKGDILYRAMLEIGAHESEGATDLYNEDSHASGVFQTLTSTVRDTAKDSDYYGPKAQELTGKSRQEVSKMTAAQIQNWMQTDFTANAVFGAIELIKLAKGLKNKGEGKYLRQLTSADETDYQNAII
jgi:hypothetical protein